MKTILTLIDIFLLILIVKYILLIRKDYLLKKRCTKEISVEVDTVIRRSTLTSSEFWTSYKVNDQDFNNYTVSWDKFHPYTKGQKGVLYLNPENQNEFTYSDKLMLKKHFLNLIIIIISSIFIIISFNL